MIYIIDNFLDQDVLAKTQEDLKKNKFEEIKTPNKLFWIQPVNPKLLEYILLKMEIEEGYDLETTGAFFREAIDGKDIEWRIHCDVKPIPNEDQPNRAAVLYMNDNKNDDLNGTAFWAHKKHGYCLDHNKLNEYNRLLKDDANDKNKWILKSIIGAQTNRLVSYPSNYFHSKYPNEFKESRIVLVIFYKTKPPNERE